MTSECFVYIVLPGATEFVTAGRIRISPSRDGVPVGEFVYGRSYLGRSDAVELDPVELKLANTRYQTARMKGFFGAIRDAMPDDWGRRIIERHIGSTHLDEFDYLLYGADDRAGALGFGRNDTPPAPRRNFNRALELAMLQQTAEAILADEQLQMADTPDARQVEQLLLHGTSMGGARPKAVIEDDDALWIAKFTTAQDRWSHPRVEHAMLQLARQCGLNVADSKLDTVAGKDVLLVRRFDRDKAEQDYRRHRMVSALTLLRTDADATARENWSYLSLADELRRISSSPQQDLRELFGRMCFNALVSNTDDHPRNHAVIAKDRSWRLSPAYDLTPTPMIAREQRNLALDCGARGRIASRENLLSACGRFLLSQEEAVGIVDEMVAVIQTQRSSVLHQAGVSDRDISTIESAFLYDGFFYERS